MAAFWYVGRDGTGKGPIEAGEIGWRIKSGEVTPDTLVWMESMPEWKPAREVDALRESFAGASAHQPPPQQQPPPPPRPDAAPGSPVPRVARVLPGAAASAPPAHLAGKIGPLGSDVEVWGLFWRAIVAFFGQVTIVFAPWASVNYWKYLGERTKFADATRFSFGGQPGDIWWVFVLQGALLWSNQVKYVGMLGFVANLGLSWLILRWFCEKLRVGESGPNLSFDGGFVPFLGYAVLSFLSIFTIIGWAWVVRSYMRWACAHVRGPFRFEFDGRATEILWRGALVIVACLFLIPIPWAIAWFVRWFVSQIAVTGAQGA